MLKSILAAGAVITLAALPATAESFNQSSRGLQLKQGTSPMLPPPGYKSQWWMAPNNCEYSRAGRPGETVWYLIINTAHSGCEKYLVEKGYSDVY